MTMKIQTLLAALVLAVISLHAQQTAASKDADTAKPENSTEAKQQPAKQPEKHDSYRFRYTLAELNGKEKVNARSFEILTTSRGEINTKTRVPVILDSKGQQYQYMDAGLDFNMDAWPRGQDEMLLKVAADLSTFVKPEDHAPGGPEKNLLPLGNSLPGGVITRRTTIKADAAVVKIGVHTVIGTAEDVASSHSYELSVTVTRQ